MRNPTAVLKTVAAIGLAGLVAVAISITFLIASTVGADPGNDRSTLVLAPAVMAPPQKPESLSVRMRPTTPPVAVAKSENPWADFPNACETFEERITPSGVTYWKRHRKRLTTAEKVRSRELVRLVATEMGADPILVMLWASRESSYRSNVIHILNPDVEANRWAYSRYTYTKKRETELVDMMEKLGAVEPQYWKAKEELSRRRSYKGNPFWDARVTYETVYLADERRGIPEERLGERRMSAWALGYGHFGFNGVLFTHRWSAGAPPWIMCDPVASSVTRIWTARTGRNECVSLGLEPTNETVNRRASQGHCEPGKRDRLFRKRAAAWKLDIHKTAKLGKKYPSKGADRLELYRELWAKVDAAGLAPPEGLPVLAQ